MWLERASLWDLALGLLLVIDILAVTTVIIHTIHGPADTILGWVETAMAGGIQTGMDIIRDAIIGPDIRLHRDWEFG